MATTRGLWTDRPFDRVLPPVVVLIIDDDMAGAQALAAVLVIEGFRTTIVDSGLAAFRVPLATTPHVVVILDIEMPTYDGFAVASAMRGSSRLTHTPIIAYTSLAEADVEERGKQARIDAFCRKGVSIQPLLDLIEHVAPI
jgi:CheY-like chemotaxis protein